MRKVELGLYGYIGYLPSDKAIYVIFRAVGDDIARSVDLDGKLVDYHLWPECEGCKIHRGY
jgi:hypothetical protein